MKAAAVARSWATLTASTLSPLAACSRQARSIRVMLLAQ